MLPPATSRRARWIAILAGTVSATVVVAACSTTSGGSPDSTDCPAPPLKVVVTTNVWGSVVDQLAGACAEVHTIVSSPTADPHDFEPTAATAATFAAADIAVMNGLGYDSWADRIVSTLGAQAPDVVNLGSEAGLKAGDNPHIWYSPAYVQQSAAVVTARMKAKSPVAAGSFDASAQRFSQALGPYLARISEIKTLHGGTRIGQTESLFAHMAQATGLIVTTPAGYLRAADSGSHPSPQDIQTFRTQLSDGTDKALVFNVQTDGALPQQMRAVAAANAVPVVDVTETLVPTGATFQAWQLAQLDSLLAALSNAT